MYVSNRGHLQPTVTQTNNIVSEKDSYATKYKLLKNKYEKIQALFDNCPIALMSLDSNQNITAVNESCTKALGVPFSVCLDSSFPSFLSPQSYLYFIEEFNACRSACDTREINLVIRCGSNKSKTLLAFISSHCNNITGLIETTISLIDASRQTNVENQLRKAKGYLERLANSDSLTGLSNRMHFQEVLRSGLISSRKQNAKVALLYFDIDGFKKINDQFGHHEGDTLLCALSNRLRSRTREVGKLARIGGDEFVMMIDFQGSIETVKNEARKILSLVSEPVELRTSTINVTSSIGISVYPDNAKTPEQLLQQADASMYKAKNGGGNNVSFFCSTLNAQITRRSQLEKALIDGSKLNQFRSVYQPIVRTDTMDVEAYECLLRWTHPELGIINPTEFIPLAERSGEILKLGDFVLEHSCKLLAKHSSRKTHMKVAINLSPVQFSDELLVDKIEKCLTKFSVPAEAIEFEITENCLFENRDTSRSVAEALTSLGCTLSIDDFGTGYSSFSRLIELPVSKLKIDRSIVCDISKSANSRSIVKGITTIAHELGMSVVAEGVESAGQVDILQSMGCDFLQGYAVCPPVETSSSSINPRFKSSFRLQENRAVQLACG